MRKRSLLALVCLLLWASPTFAAITRHASPVDEGNSGGGTTYGFNYTVGSGSNRLLVGSCFLDAGDVTPPTTTYNSVAMSTIGPVAGGGDRPVLFVYLLNPASGSNAFLMTFATGATRRCQMADYDGVGAFDTSATNTANFTNAITVTPTVAASTWVMAANREGCGGGDTWTGQTELLAGGGLHLADSNAGVSAGAYTVTATQTGCQTSLIAASFTDAGGGGGPAGCKNGLLMQGVGCEVQP